MIGADLTPLDGKTVLVRSSRDRRNPQTALRGTLQVFATPTGEKAVQVLLDFPEMFTATAHRKRIVLDETTVESLFQSENVGTYECTLDYDFEDDTEGRSLVAPRATGGTPR